ncbi:DUF2007 domain-containing protein [Marinicella litoralis]|uniref:Putative signal transducing protein n=1 Tax=Marinicella litoralis TaxID=644220 RepID=A0A4R6XUT9_9GAMM|nr:DUF2007 domain-containing protein [Marinicella litoralis]TDR23606.1 putative signal transducing protein [Marinicella litoralis]
MKKIFVDELLTWVIQAKNTLEEANIPCFIKNEFSTSAAGEVPFFETWPELWIHRDADWERALELVQPLRESRKSQPENAEQLIDWTCSQCGETNEGHFALCWSCGRLLDTVTE